MRGRSTRERDFQRECEDAPRENAISLGPLTLNIGGTLSLPFLHLGPPTLNIGRTLSLPFLHLGPPTLNIGRTLGLPFLHLGPPTLHVGSRFCMSAHRIPSGMLDDGNLCPPVPRKIIGPHTNCARTYKTKSRVQTSPRNPDRLYTNYQNHLSLRP